MLFKELEAIIANEKDVIPFLKKLSPKEKITLVPAIKKLNKKIQEQKSIEKKVGGGISYSYKYTYSEKKRSLMTKVCFVCFNKKDIQKTFFNITEDAISDDYLENIIPWYTPKWYSDVIKEQPWGLSYDKMMLLSKPGILAVSKELILDKITRACIEHKKINNKKVNYYNVALLLKYKETLATHLWYFFEEESDINNYYNYSHIENYKDGNNIWKDTITSLVEDNKLDRRKVLIATIYTATKGFNRSLSGWFYDLLLQLNITDEEVLSLQSELNTALHSTNSKVVNTVLKFYKKLVNNSQFKINEFLENASILLNSATKSVVTTTLTILDKIAKANTSIQLEICKIVTEVFINVDEKIQIKASKIIIKYSNVHQQELLDEIALYSDNLYHTTKQVLEGYIQNGDDVEVLEEVEEFDFLSEENKLPKHKTFDSLLFFVSQVIDYNQVYDVGLLLSNLPKLATLITIENVDTLEPVFKRSLNYSINFDYENNNTGILEYLSACYINDFAVYLLKKYPDSLSNYKQIKEKQEYNHGYRQEELERKSGLETIYKNHHSLFLQSKQFIKKGLTLDLLSTPTHDPCWVSPFIFIERLLAYEKAGEEINIIDFQIAVGRFPIVKETKAIVKAINNISDKEIKEVLNYHFNKLDITKAIIAKPALWIQSVLIKNNSNELILFEEEINNSLIKEKGLYKWLCQEREHSYTRYDYSSKKDVLVTYTNKELWFEDFEVKALEKKPVIVVVKKVLHKKNRKELKNIYDFMFFEKKNSFTRIQPNDDVRFLFLSPRNPSPFLANMIHHNLKTSDYFDETAKRNMISVLKGLYQIWCRKDYNEITYLFLATGFLCNNKVAREIASEIWIKGNSEDTMNNALLGELLGKLELSEYGPLKRFTDLIAQNLYNVSTKHNKMMLVLLDNMIPEMNNIPIRGTKKIIEFLIELKFTFNDFNINKTTLDKLKLWSETKSLKTTIKKII